MKHMPNFGFGFGMMSVLFPLVFFAVFAIIIAVIVMNLLKWHKNNKSPVLTVPVIVVSKRQSVHHHHNAHHAAHTSTAYYATFEVESGDRMELSVPSSEIGYLVEQDRGRLTFQGTCFLRFERDSHSIWS